MWCASAKNRPSHLRLIAGSVADHFFADQRRDLTGVDTATGERRDSTRRQTKGTPTMSNFSAFYQNGGLFMHFISLGAAVALTAVLLHGRARRIGSDKPKLLRLADRAAGLCVAFGLLGSVFGLIEMCVALSMVEPELIVQAATRGGAIVPVTLGWALICAIPIWIATTVNGARGPAAS
jgi:hypothetical protein